MNSIHPSFEATVLILLLIIVWQTQRILDRLKK